MFVFFLQICFAPDTGMTNDATAHDVRQKNSKTTKLLQIKTHGRSICAYDSCNRYGKTQRKSPGWKWRKLNEKKN